MHNQKEVIEIIYNKLLLDSLEVLDSDHNYKSILPGLCNKCHDCGHIAVATFLKLVDSWIYTYVLHEICMLELKVDKAAAKYITFNMYGNMAVSITILAY